MGLTRALGVLLVPGAVAISCGGNVGTETIVDYVLDAAPPDGADGGLPPDVVPEDGEHADAGCLTGERLCSQMCGGTFCWSGPECPPLPVAPCPMP